MSRRGVDDPGAEGIAASHEMELLIGWQHARSTSRPPGAVRLRLALAPRGDPRGPDRRRRRRHRRRRHARIAFVYHCFARVVIHGYRLTPKGA
jgi:hypothetical protein